MRDVGFTTPLAEFEGSFAYLVRIDM